MNTVFALLTVQCLLGAFDNFWHHELEADLPHEPGARTELALHTARELLYGLIFGSIAWWRWQGSWAGILVAILLAEIVITVTDFVVEDRTRRLPPLERVLHTVLALSYGATLAVFAPQLSGWMLAPTGFARADYGAWSWLMTLFSLGVFAWGLRDLLAVARLGSPAWQRRPLMAGSSASPRVVLVTGATGFIGSALTRQLVANGDHVIALSRRPSQARDRFGPWVEVCGSLDEIGPHRQIDAIVNLAGAPVAGFWWTRARRRLLIDSRLSVTRQVVALIHRLEYKPAVLVSASAIGFYGDRGNQDLREDSGDRDGFLSEVCRRWEAAAVKAERAGVRVVRLRIGLVLGDGGVLKPLVLACRLALGAVLGNGRQWQSWIHLRDLLRMIDFAIGHKDLRGACNAVAPEPVTQREFAGTLASTLRRPLVLRIPAVVLRLLAGEMSALFLISQRVVPARVVQAGFRFEHGSLGPALRQLLRTQAGDEAACSIYANEEVGLCRAETAFYERRALRHGRALKLRSVHRDAAELQAFGLGTADLSRRLYVRRQDGELRSGIDALVAIWRQVPGCGPLAFLFSLAGLHAIGEVLYELVLAPALRQPPRETGEMEARTASRQQVSQ